jgi:hypothetical protein
MVIVSAVVVIVDCWLLFLLLFNVGVFVAVI